jgi:hypothetical protein
VTNANDICSNTPSGSAVNAQGCRDQDGDGVAENNDPNDNNGCIPNPSSSACNDSDGDGVVNGTDLCPNTPNGTTVNSVGCPDADGDGVFANMDPNDNNGCIPNPNASTCNDSDGDGVVNANDLCANTPTGVAVNSAGCPDLDGDGVFANTDPNDNDACNPNPVGGLCDADGDGVNNDKDSCPNTPVGFAVNLAGCRDLDGDGIPENTDTDDTNPCVPDNSGATCDSDGDGVINQIDQCPNTPTGVDVTVYGCQDLDGDGFSKQLPSTSPFYDPDDENECIPVAASPDCQPDPQPDLFLNFTFGNTTYTVGDSRYVIINVNEIANVATSGEITLFIPNSAGFTYTFEPTLTNATVLTSEPVNNFEWTASTIATGTTLTTSTIISANGRSRIALRVTANNAGTKANLSPSVSGGNDGVLTNNIAVLAQSIQN